MKRVLVTGASGFIGFHLVQRLLRERAEVRCLVRRTSRIDHLNSPDVSFVYGELSDPASLRAAVEGVDLIVHLAGRVRARNLDEFLEANARGTARLAEAAASGDHPPIFVSVSSLAVMGPSSRDQPHRETDAIRPITDYGRSKLEGEKSLLPFTTAMPCSVVRPGIVFGEGDTMNLELFKTVKKLGIIPNPGRQERIYSWIHAADLVELILRIVKNGERMTTESFTEDSGHFGQGIYFAASDDGMTLTRIGREIGRSLGKKRTVTVKCPPVAVWGVSTFYEIAKRISDRPTPYDWDKALESMHHWRCSPEKARRQLSFEPLEPFERRIDETTQWYRENDLL